MRNQKGFTLVEVVTAGAILVMVLALGYAIFSFSNNSYRMQNEQAEAVASARFSMDYILKKLRGAETLELDASSVLKVDGVEIKLVGDTIMDGSEVLGKGIDELTMVINGSAITIKIVVDRDPQPDFVLYSTFHQRMGGSSGQTFE